MTQSSERPLRIDLERLERVADTLDVSTSLSADYLKFASILRAPRCINGERENDAEHSFHLGLIATELAAMNYPDLNTGLIAEYSLFHDLLELRTGDVWTLRITPEQAAKKKRDEKRALKKAQKDFPPHTYEMLKRYHEGSDPEARFVRLVDKLTPNLIHLLNGRASTLREDYDISSADELLDILRQKNLALRDEYPEFDIIHDTLDLICISSSQHIFKPERRIANRLRGAKQRILGGAAVSKC